MSWVKPGISSFVTSKLGRLGQDELRPWAPAVDTSCSPCPGSVQRPAWNHPVTGGGFLRADPRGEWSGWCKKRLSYRFDSTPVEKALVMIFAETPLLLIYIYNWYSQSLFFFRWTNFLSSLFIRTNGGILYHIQTKGRFLLAILTLHTSANVSWRASEQFKATGWLGVVLMQSHLPCPLRELSYRGLWIPLFPSPRPGPFTLANFGWVPCSSFISKRSHVSDHVYHCAKSG